MGYTGLTARPARSDGTRGPTDFDGFEPFGRPPKRPNGSERSRNRFRIIAKTEFCIEFKLFKCETQNVDRICSGSCPSQTETSKRMFRHPSMDRCPKSSAPNRRSRTAGGKSESLRDRRAGTLVRASLSLFRRCLNFCNSTRRHMLGIQHAARNKTNVSPRGIARLEDKRSLNIAIAIEAELSSISKSLLSGLVSPIEIPIPII